MTYAQIAQKKKEEREAAKEAMKTNEEEAAQNAHQHYQKQKNMIKASRPGKNFNTIRNSPRVYVGRFRVLRTKMPC